MGREDYDELVEYDYEAEPEYEDGPDEFVDNPEETEEALAKELEALGIWWGDSIARIENPERQQERIEKAEKLLEQGEELSRKSESGEINDCEFLDKAEDLRSAKSKEAFKSDLDSVELGSGELGQLAEECGNLATGDIKWIEINDQVNRFVKEDPEHAQEAADRMFDEGRLSEEAYQKISEKAKRYK